jgi:hypothetical protein
VVKNPSIALKLIDILKELKAFAPAFALTFAFVFAAHLHSHQQIPLAIWDSGIIIPTACI